MTDMENNTLIQKILSCYSDIFSYESARMFVDDLSPLLETNSKYRRPIKEWLNGKSVITEISLDCLDGHSTWSLNEVAKKLDASNPNVPVAALLLSLYEEFPVTISEILSVCDEFCWCDERIIVSFTPECSFAYLDTEYEQWFFLNDKSNTESLKLHQLWQVLLQITDLAPIISMELDVGTTIEKGEDEKYHIEPPEITET